MNQAPRLLSLALRALALGGKLVVILVLARFLGPGDVARFGLVSATVGYASFVAGLEFYNYSIRQISISERACQSKIVTNHFSFVLLAQILVGLAALGLLATGLVPSELFVTTALLTIAEHWAQEGYRTLVALSRPVYASIALFLRQGVWVLFVIFCFAALPETRTLDFVLSVWLFGVGFAAIWAGIVIFRTTGFSGLSSLDPGWIRKGIPIALVFLGASFGLRSVNVLDRFIQLRLGDEISLAAYVLFFGIAISLIAALDAGAFSFSLPKVLAAGQENTREPLAQEIRRLMIITLSVSALFMVASILFGELSLDLLGIAAYWEYVWILYILSVAIIFQAISMVFHFGLYALGKDRIIFLVNLLTLFVFLIFVGLFQNQGHYAVSMALMVSFFFLMLWKGLFFARYISEPVGTAPDALDP